MREDLLGGGAAPRPIATGARLEARLQQQGVSTKGTITERAAGTLTLNNVKQRRLRYEYEDAQGHRHVQTLDLPEDEARLWNVGDVGLVRYDSAMPADAVWLGRS